MWVVLIVVLEGQLPGRRIHAAIQDPLFCVANHLHEAAQLRVVMVLDHRWRHIRKILLPSMSSNLFFFVLYIPLSRIYIGEVWSNNARDIVHSLLALATLGRATKNRNDHNNLNKMSMEIILSPSRQMRALSRTIKHLRSPSTYVYFKILLTLRNSLSFLLRHFHQGDQKIRKK